LSLFYHSRFPVDSKINPLNAEINHICHLLALLGAHHILHVSRTGDEEGFKEKSAILHSQKLVFILQGRLRIAAAAAAK
jgi:hypothetical protein